MSLKDHAMPADPSKTVLTEVGAVGGVAFNRGVDVGARIAELAAEVKRLNDLYYGAGDSPLPDADYER